MNLNEINSVNELIEANEQTEDKSPAELVKEHLFTLEAPEALSVLKEAVSQLAQWHQSKASEADTTSEASAWSVDEGRLHIALLALNEVTF